MENPACAESYEEAKKKAKEFYRKIGRVWCLALNEHVIFNSAGFRHLVWKGAEQRPKQEQERRFKLLLYAEDILTTHYKAVEFREEINMRSVKKYGKKMKELSRARFWGLVSKRNGKTITLVIRQINRGNKHFFSIY